MNSQPKFRRLALLLVAVYACNKDDFVQIRWVCNAKEMDTLANPEEGTCLPPVKPQVRTPLENQLDTGSNYFSREVRNVLCEIYSFYNRHTYRQTLCGWSPSPTSRANLSDCWKEFSLPVRQCPIHAIWQGTGCKLVMAYPLDWHSKPIPNGQPLGYSRPAGTWLLPLPSCHITRIGTPAGWTMATHSTGGRGGLHVQMYTQASFKHGKRLVELINKSVGHTRYKLQYTNL